MMFALRFLGVYLHLVLSSISFAFVISAADYALWLVNAVLATLMAQRLFADD